MFHQWDLDSRNGKRIKMINNGEVSNGTIGWRRVWQFGKKRLRGFGILLGLVVIVVVLSIVSDDFLKLSNLINILRQSSMVGIMAVGMTFVLIVGGFDLSVGAIMGLAGALAVALQIRIGLVPALAVALLFGALAGLLNGLLVTKLHVNAFVVTLGTMNIFRGLLLAFLGGQTLISQNSTFGFIGSGYVGPIPIPVLLFALVTIVSAFALHRTRFGRYIYAVGGNEEAAIYSGIGADVYRTASFGIVGLLSALAGIILASRLQSVAPMAGSGYELDAIAAVVIGGTSISGGEGSIWRTIIGVLVLSVIGNGFNILDVNEYVQLVFKGAIVVAAVAFDAYSKRRE